MSPWLIPFATIVVAILIYHLLKLKNGPSLPLPPGPRPWPIVGNLPHMGPVPHRSLTALAQTYGPLLYLRMGITPMVIAASASVAEQFLKVHDLNFCNRPLNFRTTYLTYNKQDLAFAPYGPRWRLRRKISNLHMLSAKAVDDFSQLRQEEVKRLVHNLPITSKSKAVKLGELLNICTTNTLTRVMIGRRLLKDDNSYDPRANEFRSIVMDLLILLGVFNIGDFVPILDWLDLQGVRAKTKNLHERLDAFLTTILKEHKVFKNEQHQNLLSVLLLDKETHQEGELLEQEIKAIFADILIAGTDTSSSTIEWAIAELIKNPQIMLRVQQELNIVVGQDRLVTELDLPNLPYLQAIVKETFRLHPPTPLSLPRVAEESCEIFGYHIPKGATLLVNVWAIGRDPKEWIDPLVFKPERFLPGSEKANVDVKGNNFEVIPFGAGRRICSGVTLGLKVVQLLIATLAHAFDWELENGLDPKNLNMDEAYGLTLQRVVPLSAHPRPRLAKHVYSSLSSS